MFTTNIEIILTKERVDFICFGLTINKRKIAKNFIKFLINGKNLAPIDRQFIR